METQKINRNGVEIALITSPQAIITDGQSALELVMNIAYHSECSCIAVEKKAIADEFFILSTGIAGDVLQKFSNYHTKLAIYGDFSAYTSKPLKDFIYECNKGNHIFFAPNQEQAIEMLANAR